MEESERTPVTHADAGPRALRARGGALAALAIVVALTSAIAADRAQASLPPQGLYEQCAPNSVELDCGARLREMSDAGFQYVLNYTAWYGSAEQVRNYADQAAAAGIKLIWPLNDRAWRDGTDLVDHYRYLGPDCHCASNADFKQFALGLVKDHPATWGFYIGDEVIPSQENIAQVAALSSEVGQIAPGKPTLYITLPRHSLEQQLAPFAPLADIAGTDYYPVGLDPDLSRMPGVASTTRRVTAQQGSGSALVMQAFSWSQYEPQGSTLFPSRAEMLQMRNLGIRHGDPDLILWYAYNDILDSADANAHWQDLRAAAFAPHIKVSRVPSGCARARFRPRVTVRTASRLRSARAELDGRLLRRATKGSFRVPVRSRRLRRGRHRLRIVAVDSAGRRATTSASFRRCA